MASETTPHWFVNVPGLPAPFDHVNMDTLMMTWFTMGLILVVAFLISRNLKLYPTRFQTFGETLFDLTRSITTSTAEKRGDTFLFYIGSLFIFILTANLLGQLPLKFLQLVVGYHKGELVAATGDFNTTAALAIFTVVMYFYIGLKAKGPSYFKHYVSPHWAFMPINMVEDLTRPFSLMLRLYANILVGELLTMIALATIPFVLPVFVILLELFVAFVQAYIFSILSSVYISLLSAKDH